MCFCIIAKAQLPLWSFPENTIDLTLPNYPPSPLPIATQDPNGVNISWPNGYDGRSAKVAHNIMHDKNGELLFFIVDGYIFDKKGWLISDEMANNYTGDGHFSIVPVPNDCNKYYILGSTLIYLGDYCVNNFVQDLLYGVLDMGIQGYNVAPIGGMTSNVISLRNQIPQSTYPNNYRSQYWSANAKQRGTTHTITTIENNVSYLFVATYSAIIRYKIDQTGINYDNYGWVPPSNLYPSVANYELIDLVDIYDNTETEIIKLNNGNYVMAFESVLRNTNSYLYAPAISIININGSTKQVTPSSLQVLPYDFNLRAGAIPGDGYFTSGLEITPNGQYLYISHKPTSLHPKAIEVYDINNQTYVNQPNIPNLESYKYSQLEIGYDGDLYMANQNGLAKITNPGNPISSNHQNVSSFSYSPSFATRCPTISHVDRDTVYTIPKQIDGEDPFLRFTKNCCKVIGGFGHNYTAPMGYNYWTLGQNPFNNTTDNVFITGDLRIPTGANVNIVNMTFYFAENSRMIIEKGARVYLNGSVLTSDECDGIMWQGVRVEGNSNANQNYNNQGYLYMNNSEISNAYIGVALHKRDVNNNIDWNTNGGIIRAKDSKFKNNRRDAIFLTYNNYSSTSYFTNCDFKTTIHPLANGTSTPNVHVSILDNKNIKFTGCRFSNTTNSPISRRGKGIESIDAGYEVSFLCNVFVSLGNPCPINNRTISSFSNLEYGIDAKSVNNMSNTITVKYTDFIENNRSVHFNGIPNYTFVNNNVKVGRSLQPGHFWPYGLYSSNCTGYKIENNRFVTQHNIQTSYGLIMNNSNNNGVSADKNEVYNNYFNNLHYAVFNMNRNVQLNNGNPVGGTGVTYRCNNFNNSKTTDIYDGFLGTSGISIHQGSCSSITSPSNNLYSAVNPTRSNFWNSNPSNFQITNTISQNGPSRLTPTLENPAITHNSYCSPNYNYDLSCPVNRFDIPDLGIIVLRNKIQTFENEKNADISFLNTIDENVNNLWERASSGEISWEYFKNELIQNYSPFVSENMLAKIIENTTSIPNGYIKEIAINNSPLSYKTKEHLASSNLPNNVKNQILISNIEDVNPREEIQSRIYQNEGKIALLERDIVKQYLTDSTSNGLLSAISFYEEKTDISSKQKLVDLYRQNNQTQAAETLLASISNESTNDNYLEFQSLLLRNENIFSTDKNNYLAIRNISNPNYKTNVASRANAVLEFLNKEKILEVQPYVLKSSYYAPKKETDIQTDKNIIIYPNPTKGVVTIELLLDKNEKAECLILNNLGEVVEKYEITNTKSYINIEKLPKGVYFLKINSKNKHNFISKIIKL